MEKIINPISIKEGKRFLSVFCQIKFEDSKLSISGVISPQNNSNCLGSCGQIENELIDPLTEKRFQEGWTAKLVKDFVRVWKEWHLNDLQAGCKHQREACWDDIRINPKELPNSSANRDKKGILAMWVKPKEHKMGVLGKPCPICGYKFGTEWRKKEVPKKVINFLEALPKSKKKPAWI